MLDLFVLLDRDGVINYDSDQFIKTPDEWQAIPGSLEAIARLNASGYKVVVITNQSGLARGMFSEATLQAIHNKFMTELAEHNGKIDRIYYCPHGPDQGCNCRKPKPGMLEQFASDYKANLNEVIFIGDTINDVHAAQNANAQPILVKTGKGIKTIKNNPNLLIPIFENLYEATDFILS